VVLLKSFDNKKCTFVNIKMKDLSYSYKDIIVLAIPLMISNFFYTLISFADVAFMKEIGLAEQGAINFVALLYLIFFMISFAYTKGTQIFIARKEGEDKKSHVGVILDNTIFVLGIVGIFLFLLFAFFSKEILNIFLEEPAVLQAAMDYIEIRKYGFIYGFMGSVFISYYTGISRVKTLAIAIIIMAFSNIFLNYVLVFGKFGFPEMGIKGAALASNIAEFLSIAIMAVNVFTSKLNKRHLLFSFRLIKWEYIKVISKISMPIVVLTLLGLLTWLIFFALIEKMGVIPFAISGSIKQIYTVFGISAFALSSATNTIISNVIGQKKYDEIIPLTKRLVIVSLGFIMVFIATAYYFRRGVLRLIMEDSLIESSLPILNITLVALIIYSIGNVIYNTVVTLGSNRISLFILFAVVVAYSIFAYYVFYVVQTDLELAWITEWVYWSSLLIISTLYLKFANWKKHLTQ
jgi:putative MATE family efflux protein